MHLTNPGLLYINYRDALPNVKERLKCNFKCSYCNQNEIKERSFTEKDFEQARTLWDKLGQIEDEIIVRLNFDGEILIDEYARKIVAYVANRPNVKFCEVITNNSLPPQKYLNEFPVEKMSFNCSYHPECMTLKRFLENILYLKNTGRPVFATMVVTPSLVKKLPDIARAFKDSDICFRPLLLLGAYQPGIPSPLKKFYRKFCEISGQGIYPQAYKPSDLATIKKYYYSELEFDYQYGRSTKNELCFAGADMINLFMDGTLMRCFGGRIGDINDLMEGRIELPQTAYPCYTSKCQCPAHMIYLKNFREQYPVSKIFVDHYDKKGACHA